MSPPGTTGSSSNLQFKAERIKIPLTPRYPRSVMGSDRGKNWEFPPVPAAPGSPSSHLCGLLKDD